MGKPPWWYVLSVSALGGLLVAHDIGQVRDVLQRTRVMNDVGSR